METLKHKHTNKSSKHSNLHVDFSAYKSSNSLRKEINPDGYLTKENLAILKQVGVLLNKNPETGKFLLYDNNEYVIPSGIKGVEVLPLQKAIELYPEITEKYLFKAIDKNPDDFTRQTSQKNIRGYFIRVRKNTKLSTPINAGLFMQAEKCAMHVHNVVVVEEGAHLHLITGCTSGRNTIEGLHVAISEHFVGKNARFTNTMIHNWGPGFVVRPGSATLVDENGSFVSNYYSINPPKNIVATPFTILSGKNASAKYMTVLACLQNTFSDIGGTVLMQGENSSAELVARAVNYGGTVLQTGLLIGAAKNARGHVDCSGLMLGKNGIIEAIPGLRSVHPDARMSHEAAIGRINMGEVNYLRAKGLDEMQAVALIIRGFMNIGIEIEGLDESLEKSIKQIAELSGHGE